MNLIKILVHLTITDANVLFSNWGSHNQEIPKIKTVYRNSAIRGGMWELYSYNNRELC